MKGWMLASLLGLVLVACGSNDGKLKITEIEPRTGDVMGGQTVALKGQGFRTVTRSARVYFGGEPGNVTRIGDNEIIVQAPGGKVGSVVDVLVVFEPGGELSVPKAFTYVQTQNVDVKD